MVNMTISRSSHQRQWPRIRSNRKEQQSCNSTSRRLKRCQPGTTKRARSAARGRGDASSAAALCSLAGKRGSEAPGSDAHCRRTARRLIGHRQANQGQGSREMTMEDHGAVAQDAASADRQVLADLLRAALTRVPGAGWEYSEEDFWTRVTPNGYRFQQQGWKLHVSATPLSAPVTLARCASVLFVQGCAFEVLARDLERVQELRRPALPARQRREVHHRLPRRRRRVPRGGRRTRRGNCRPAGAADTVRPATSTR